MVEKIDMLSNTLSMLQTLMVQNGLFGNQQMAETDKVQTDKDGKSLQWTNSETTIYRNAIPKLVQPVQN